MTTSDSNYWGCWLQNLHNCMVNGSCEAGASLDITCIRCKKKKKKSRTFTFCPHQTFSRTCHIFFLYPSTPICSEGSTMLSVGTLALWRSRGWAPVWRQDEGSPLMMLQPTRAPQSTCRKWGHANSISQCAWNGKKKSAQGVGGGGHLKTCRT